MAIRNLMTAQGFNDGLSMGGDWMMAWVYIGVLGTFVFLGEMVLKRNYDYPFNLAGALIGPLLAILIITFTGASKIAFIVGLIGLVAGAFFMDQIMGGG